MQRNMVTGESRLAQKREVAMGMLYCKYEEHECQCKGKVRMTVLFRLLTFGAFAMERLSLNAPDGHAAHYETIAQKEWSNRGPAMTMLKVLLCRTRRRAPKDILIDAIWSEDEQERMKSPEGALKSATNVLRDILRQPDGDTALMTIPTREGLVYQLPDQGRLWVDADAFVSLVGEAAKAEHTEEDALPVWEAAFALLRGEFLEDDLYAEWVQAKRQEIEGDRSLCISRLARLYEARNRPQQAEALLHSFLASHPTDEDALCLLLDLLTHDERWSEAERVYRKTERALREDAVVPTPLTQRWGERLAQAHHLATSLEIAPNTWLSQKESFTQHLSYGIPLISQSPHMPLWTSPYLPTEQSAWLTQGASYLGQLFSEGWSSEEILESLQVVLQGVQGIPTAMRRKLLILGADVIISDIHTPTTRSISTEEQEQICLAWDKSIDISYKFFHKANIAQVFAIGKALLSVLQQNHTILPSRIRNRFYAGVHNLIGISLQHQGQYHAALDAHTNAHIAALGSGETLEVIRSLLCQINVYQALGQYRQAFEVIEEALRILSTATDEELLRAKGQLFVCWADHAMQVGEYRLAQQKLAESEMFLESIVPNEEFDRSSWLEMAGKYAFMTKDYQTAIQHYEKALMALSSKSIVRQTLILVPLLSTYTSVWDREGCLTTLEKTSAVVQLLKSPIINKLFTDSVQGMSRTFENDVDVQHIIAQTLH